MNHRIPNKTIPQCGRESRQSLDYNNSSELRIDDINNYISENFGDYDSTWIAHIQSAVVNNFTGKGICDDRLRKAVQTYFGF